MIANDLMAEIGRLVVIISCAFSIITTVYALRRSHDTNPIPYIFVIAWSTIYSGFYAALFIDNTDAVVGWVRPILSLGAAALIAGQAWVIRRLLRPKTDPAVRIVAEQVSENLKAHLGSIEAER